MCNSLFDNQVPAIWADVVFVGVKKVAGGSGASGGKGGTMTMDLDGPHDWMHHFCLLRILES